VRDLLVAGAGPAGLATALHAARSGLDVAVLDTRPGDGDKACGEGLMPGALRELLALGVDPEGLAFSGITYRQGDRCAVAAFSGGPGRGVRRTALVSALRAAVVDAGIPVVTGPALPLSQAGDRVRVGGLEARWLAAADGLHSPVRAALGLGRPGRVRRWGLRRHVAVRPWTDTVEVTWAHGAEAYVTPIGPELVGVAVLTGTPAAYDAQLAAFPALRERLAGEFVTPVRGAGPLRQRVRSRVAGRVLLVGDAAGYVDALTGEGIGAALIGARELVRCVATGRPEAYEAAWRRGTRQSRWATAVLLGLRSSPAGPAVVPAAAWWPRGFGTVVDTLGG
jgi:flavin-dependent dehydrogenase